MRGTFVIEIGHKPQAVEPLGRGLLAQTAHLSLGRIRAIRASQLYRLVGEITPEQKDRIAQSLLCDPVVQDYKEGGWPAEREDKKFSAKTPAIIDVWYKQGVTDVVGESVAKGIQDLAIEGIEEVRTGTRYRF